MRGRVEDARRHLDRLRTALTSAFPRDIDEAMPELEQAIASIREVKAQLGGGGTPEAGLTADLTALAQDIQIAQRLTDRGREFWQRRARALAMAGGYVATGQLAPLRPGATIRVEG